MMRVKIICDESKDMISYCIDALLLVHMLALTWNFDKFHSCVPFDIDFNRPLMRTIPNVNKICRVSIEFTNLN